jgi:hypothetical protein
VADADAQLRVKAEEYHRAAVRNRALAAEYRAGGGRRRPG